MKTQPTQMEILLITDTTFLSRDLCEKDEPRRDSSSQLEEACWNGLVQTMLPEIFMEPTRDNRLYLWDVRTSDACLLLDLAEAPAEPESRFSIVPASFLSTKAYN